MASSNNQDSFPVSQNGQAGARIADGFALRRDEWGRLVLTDAAGVQHVGVYPVRAFPISDPAHGVAICAADGRELAWIDNLDDLPAAVQVLLREELTRRTLMPVVRRVLCIAPASDPAEWQVETDRGNTRFVVNSADDVRRLPDGRAIVIDAHGIRYLIPELSTLDAKSRRLLERYL